MSVWNQSPDPQHFAGYGEILQRLTYLADDGSRGLWTKLDDAERLEIVATVEAMRAAGKRGFIQVAAKMHNLHPASVHRIMAKHRHNQDADRNAPE